MVFDHGLHERGHLPIEISRLDVGTALEEETGGQKVTAPNGSPQGGPSELIAGVDGRAGVEEVSDEVGVTRVGCGMKGGPPLLTGSGPDVGTVGEGGLECHIISDSRGSVQRLLGPAVPVGHCEISTKAKPRAGQRCEEGGHFVVTLPNGDIQGT
jgi:hypothetical protein